MIPDYTPDKDLLLKKQAVLENLLSTSVVGNYKLKFDITDPETDSGTLEISRDAKMIIKGLFQVYIENNEVFTGLYSDQKVKVLCKPSEEFINILKFILLAKT
jgi:hypothetical protein